MRYIKAALLAAAVALLTGVVAQPARADISFDFAYSNLSQHGSWLVSGQYGRVWQPREYNRDWNPYYDGHWVDTDMGWTWVSDYQWGSIPYHYGTWVSDPRYGWVWIPGDIWAPSWVVFRTTPEYIGWAPVPPGFSVGVSIEFGAPSSFIFVSSRDFLAPRLRTAIIPPSRTNVFINNTTVINNIVIQNNVVINRGPDVRIIERATGQTVRRQSIEQVARVAPFEHVSREQLSVAPERVKRGLRVAEPVPESRPLPVAEKRGQPDIQRQAPAREAAPVNPSSPAERRQSDRKAQAEASVKARDVQQRTNEPTAADAQKARRGQAPAREAAPVAPSNQAAQQQSERKTQAEASAKARDTQQRANEQANANAQKARNPQPPPRDAAAAQPAEAKKAKAKADAKAKKDKKDTADPGK